MDATIYLLILIAAFIGIVVWVFRRKRKARFAKDARIPLDDGKGSAEIRIRKSD
jgi:LPXTG-motif cell wall-anchored protein